MKESLEELDDAVLVAARNMFYMLKEMLDAQTLPTADAEVTADEVEAELDRIDLEILSRGLVSPEEC